MSVRFGLRLGMACLALISLSKAGLSQTKVGVISLQRAVLGCAEIKKASAAMETKYKPRQQEMERLQRELDGIRQQLQTNAGKLTPGAEADLNAQGTRKQRELQRLNDDLQADVTAERNEILGTSGKKMKKSSDVNSMTSGLGAAVRLSSPVGRPHEAWARRRPQ